MTYPNYAYPGASPFISTILRTTVPFAVANTGTMGNNGAITLGTALAVTYPAIYLYLPAGAIQTGSAAGWYFTVMSSTTVGQVFNNQYTTGVVPVPTGAIANLGNGTQVPFVSTGPGAYTGVITTVTGPQINLPGNSLGQNSSLRFTLVSSNNNSAGAKVASAVFGASTVLTSSQTTSTGAVQTGFLSNQGSLKNQVFVQSETTGTLGNSHATNDTTTDLVVSATCSIAVATDVVVIESLVVELVP